MKVCLEIPDEYANQRMFLISGFRDLVATKKPEEPGWYVKTENCNRCGECCMGLTHKNWPVKIDEEGTCSQLSLESPAKYKCHAQATLPLMCIVYPVTNPPEYCSIKYEKQLEE